MQYQSIVCEKENLIQQLIANQLADWWKEAYGISPKPVFEDNPSERKIILGHTDEKMSYSVIKNQGNLEISAHDFYGFEEAMKQIKPILGTLEERKDGIVFSGNVSKKHSNRESAFYIENRTGDLRIMVFNIYGWSGKGGTALRTQLQKELLSFYRPDVIGFQEYGDYDKAFAYRSAMTPLMEELGYCEIPFWYQDQNRNSTPIFYLPDRVQPISENSFGGFQYANGMGDTSKSLTWATFREKETQKIFSFISTHFMWPNPLLAPEVTNAARVSDAGELIRQIRLLQQQYGKETPIFAGGDLNCFLHSDPVNKLQNELTWLYQVAEKTLEYGYHDYPTFDEEKKYFVQSWEGPEGPEQSMDFIFGTGKMKVNDYITITDQLALLSSDHSPKMADIQLSFLNKKD